MIAKVTRQRRPWLTEWDKLFIYLSVSPLIPTPPSQIVEACAHRNLGKAVILRHLRYLHKIKAIGRMRDFDNLQRILYVRKDVL